MIEIKTITLPLPFRMGRVNCYLIEADEGYILIDTGGSNNRQELVRELEKSGCKPGNLKLILLTHGDFDHTGNAAYLRQVFGSKIAMGTEDTGMVARGDMFVNRNQPNVLIRWIVPVFTGFGNAEQFVPDILLAEGDDLSEHGFDGCVISIPGHSMGSIGILTPTGELFCGDLLENTHGPALNFLTDDLPAANESLRKLRNMRVGTVYPGHGDSFPMHQLGEVSR